MIKKVNAVGSKKKQKLSLISNFFLKANNPNSKLNVDHVSTFKEIDDEFIDETNIA